MTNARHVVLLSSIWKICAVRHNITLHILVSNMCQCQQNIIWSERYFAWLSKCLSLSQPHKQHHANTTASILLETHFCKKRILSSTMHKANIVTSARKWEIFTIYTLLVLNTHWHVRLLATCLTYCADADF